MIKNRGGFFGGKETISGGYGGKLERETKRLGGEKRQTQIWNMFCCTGLPHDILPEISESYFWSKSLLRFNAFWVVFHICRLIPPRSSFPWLFSFKFFWSILYLEFGILSEGKKFLERGRIVAHGLHYHKILTKRKENHIFPSNFWAGLFLPVQCSFSPMACRLQLLQAVSASLMWIARWPGSRMCWLPNVRRTKWFPVSRIQPIVAATWLFPRWGNHWPAPFALVA